MQLKIYFFKHQKGKHERKEMLSLPPRSTRIYLDCPKMKKRIGSNIRKIHHVLAPVGQQFRTECSIHEKKHKRDAFSDYSEPPSRPTEQIKIHITKKTLKRPLIRTPQLCNAACSSLCHSQKGNSG